MKTRAQTPGKSTNMSVQTILLDFSVDSSQIGDEVSRNNVLKSIKECLEKDFLELRFLYDQLIEADCFAILSTNDGVVVTVRFFVDKGLVTLNVEYFKAEGDPPKITLDVSISSDYVNSRHFQINSDKRDGKQQQIRAGKIDISIIPFPIGEL